jgi:hypothetical protein
MPKRTAIGLAALAAGLMATIGGQDLAAQPRKDSAPKWRYAEDLRVRPGGVRDFDKDTPRIGVEFYEDEANHALIAISETGALTVAPQAQLGDTKQGFKWLSAHELAVRKVGETEFTQKTKRYGVEVFRDPVSNHLFYVCQTGSIAFAPAPAGLVDNRGPKWHHALEVKIRGPEQPSFENAKKLGLEVFKDENTGSPGTLVYITEPGEIATAAAPASPPEAKKVLPPKTAYGLVLRVRGPTEKEFTEKAKRVGIEIFEDPNAGDQLLYLSETGYVATAPRPAELGTTKGVTWLSGMTLKARKGGEKGFETAKKYGIEVFQDNRTGNLIFISDTGSIAVLPKPKA